MDTHRAVVLGMLADVLAATTKVGETVVVTNDADGRVLATSAGALVDDPGRASPAVAAALGSLDIDTVLIVNADVPCVVPHDLRALLSATPLGRIALVASADGRTKTR